MGAILTDTNYGADSFSSSGIWMAGTIGHGGDGVHNVCGFFAASNTTARAALLSAATSGLTALDALISSYTTAPGAGPSPSLAPATWWAGLTSTQQDRLRECIIVVG